MTSAREIELLELINQLTAKQVDLRSDIISITQHIDAISITIAEARIRLSEARSNTPPIEKTPTNELTALAQDALSETNSMSSPITRRKFSAKFSPSAMSYSKFRGIMDELTNSGYLKKIPRKNGWARASREGG